MKKPVKEKPVKAVVDTNVLVSGLFAASGSVAELMDLWFEERFLLTTSEDILSELERVLHKPTIQEHFKPSEEDIVEYMETLREKAIMTRGLYQTDRITKDPTDNKFLACALEAKADYIVSGDRHLREIGDFYGVKIADAKTFVEWVKKDR